jgi:hypothetical protein
LVNAEAVLIHQAASWCGFLQVAFILSERVSAMVSGRFTNRASSEPDAQFKYNVIAGLLRIASSENRFTLFGAMR